MSISSEPRVHPLVAAVRMVGECLDEVASFDPLYASAEEKAALLRELTRSIERLTALRGQVLSVASDVAESGVARSAAAWLAREAHVSPRAAVADQRLGESLRSRWTSVGDAAAAGAVTWEQATVVVHCLDALPAELDPELVTKAEAHLIAEAAHFGPAELRRLGRHVLEVIAPDIAEQAEGRALEAEEQRARDTMRLSLRPRGDGTTDLHARLPDHVAGRLRAYLDSYTSPRQSASGSDVDQPPLTQRRAEAFCALLEHVPATGLPSHGGTATTVMVTIDLESLRSGLGLAGTSTGEVITAAEARRLACTGGVVPVVLGGASEVLDLGRTRRPFSPAQRKALALRDRHCRAEGCDIPAAWCEAHHTSRPWSQGGKTDLAEGLLLCSFHHHRAHDQRYDTRRLPNGDLRYTRRT